MDANGNKTNELLIAPNTPYTVVDREGQAVSGNFVTDANGVFTLKDGQRATFHNISETAGQYYVRELMSEQTASRYNSVYVNGQVSARGGPVTVGNNSYFAFDSPVADPSLGGMSFQYVNDYSYEVLMIEKNATYLPESLYDQQAQADNTFTMQVTVNGEALPVGTKYKLLSDADTIFTVHGINTFNQNMANQVFMFTKNDQGYRVRDYLTADSMSGEWYVLQCLGKGEHVVARDGQILNYAQLKQSSLMVNSKKNFILLIPTSLYPDGLPFGVGDSDSIEDYTVPVFDYHGNSGYSDQGFGKLHVLSGESNRKNVTTPGEVIVKSGQVAVIEHLLVGSTYTVNETQHSSQGFTVSYTLNGQSVPLPSGTVENSNHWISVTVNNAEKTTSSDLGTLALEKLVDGAANGSEEFLFTLQAAELKGQTFPAYRNGATIAGGVTFDANGKATVSLRHNDKVRVVDLPKNTQVTVTETAPGFSTSIQENNVFTVHGVNTFNQNFKDQIFMFTYTESNKQLGEYLTDSDMNGKWYVIQCVPSGTHLVARDSSLRSYQELKTNGYYPSHPAAVILTVPQALYPDGLPYIPYSSSNPSAEDYVWIQFTAEDGYWSDGIGEVYINDDAEQFTKTVTTTIVGDRTVSFTVYNHSDYQLPKSGGFGSYWYIAGGLCLVLSAFLLYFLYIRKTEFYGNLCVAPNCPSGQNKPAHVAKRKGRKT